MDIKSAKKFFWVSFAVSAIFFILSAVIVLTGYDFFAEKAINMYHLSDDDFNELFVYSMAFWKILIFQFTFIPALVLTIIDKKCLTKPE